ncbi:MAG: hypothetical protein IJ970_03140 [Mycoplasmataceae bacterium]|nr:hypothetical protein [Mycoplasmataceae bacterium]
MKESKSKIKLYKWIGLGTLVGLTSISAFLVPTLVDHFQKPSLKLNHSTNTLEGNKNRIDNFVNSNVLDDYELSGSLSIFGKNSIIGQDDVELSSSERSLITVEQADNENMFKLNLKSTIIYLLNKNKIKYELDYIKPYYSDSTYPLVGIKLYYGQGSNYYERTIEYRDTRLYGFKKTIEELTIDTYISDINQNPSQYFQLKKEVGTIGDVGIYAKNIKPDDIDLNNNQKLKQLREKNYWVSLDSLSVDKKNPTLLKIKYNIIYDDGLVKAYASTKEVVLGPFDIEQGVDDPVSKLKKFIESNKDWINNLNQYFVYKKPENDENKYSIREAYQKGFISFSTTYSIKNKLEEEGISLEFKTYNQEQEIIKNKPLELSVSNYELDSTTPMYRLYFTSYENTPIEYTESVLIEGLAQEGDFAKSQEEQDMRAFYNYLVEQNYGLENIFGFVSSSQNPLALSDYFLKENKVTFQNGKYSIPFELVFSLYEKYTNSLNLYSNPYSKPFDNFNFELKLKDDKNQNISLPTNYSFESKEYNLDAISKKILESMNNKENGDFDFQLDSITNDNSSKNYLINLNVCLGSNTQGTLYTNVEPLEIYVFDFFESKETYNRKILKELSSAITQNPANIEIDVLAENVNKLGEYIENRQFSELFKNVSVFNLNYQIPFPELQPKFELKVNLDYFNSLNKQAIDQIISSKSMEIEIIISIEGAKEFIKVTKNFSDLV